MPAPGHGRPGPQKARPQPHHRLQNLGQGGGGHVPQALPIAPVHRPHRPQEHRRGQGRHRGPRQGVPQDLPAVPGSRQPQQPHAPCPQGQEQGHGCLSGPADLLPPAQGGLLRHQPGHRHREPRRGQGEHRPQIVVRCVEQPHAVGPDDPLQGDLEQGPQHLHRRHPPGEQQRPVEKALPPCPLLHRPPPFPNAYAPREGRFPPPPPNKKGPRSPGPAFLKSHFHLDFRIIKEYI